MLGYATQPNYGGITTTVKHAIKLKTSPGPAHDLQDLFKVLLQLLVVAAIILSFIVSFIACFITPSPIHRGTGYCFQSISLFVCL